VSYYYYKRYYVCQFPENLRWPWQRFDVRALNDKLFGARDASAGAAPAPEAPAPAAAPAPAQAQAGEFVVSPSGSALLVRGGQSEAEAAAERAYYESMYRYTDDGRRLVGLPRPAVVHSARHSHTPLGRHVEHVEHCAPSRAHVGPPLLVSARAPVRSSAGSPLSRAIRRCVMRRARPFWAPLPPAAGTPDTDGTPLRRTTGRPICSTFFAPASSCASADT